MLYPHLMAKTPLQNIRVPEALWRDFGLAAASMGSDRTKLLVAFMRRYVLATAVTRTAEGDHVEVQPHSAA